MVSKDISIYTTNVTKVLIKYTSSVSINSLSISYDYKPLDIIRKH